MKTNEIIARLRKLAAQGSQYRRTVCRLAADKLEKMQAEFKTIQEDGLCAGSQRDGEGGYQMILVYYRRKDGSIRMFHKGPPDKTLDEVKALATAYNLEQEGKEEAHVVQYEEDSFEAHLFKATMQRKVWDKEMVQDLISSLRSALDAACDLEGTT